MSRFFGWPPTDLEFHFSPVDFYVTALGLRLGEGHCISCSLRELQENLERSSPRKLRYFTRFDSKRHQGIVVFVQANMEGSIIYALTERTLSEVPIRTAFKKSLERFFLGENLRLWLPECNLKSYYYLGINKRVRKTQVSPCRK